MLLVEPQARIAQMNLLEAQAATNREIKAVLCYFHRDQQQRSRCEGAQLWPNHRSHFVRASRRDCRRPRLQARHSDESL